MAKSSPKRKTRSDKFSLTLYPTSQFCKKIKGKLYYFGTNKKAAWDPDDPRWIDRLKTQAAVLYDATQIGLLKEGKWLDYTCGDGKLSHYLKTKYDIELNSYDRYMLGKYGYLEESEFIQATFDFVITTSVFEHFTNREQLNRVESLVNPENGVLGIHTLVCENVPQSPSWFYLLPVHCSFHTNKSMGILFKQWGYTESVYNVDARLWLWFKKNINTTNTIQMIVKHANSRSNGPFYIYKHGFVDYWK